MHSIAYVEDDDTIRANIAEALREHGFAVEEFSSAEEALSHFESSCPDLALLDIQLGDDRYAGHDLCHSLRAHDQLVPVVFLTGHDRDIDKITGMQLGADDYITKDTSLEYMVVRVRALLRRVQAMRRAQSQAKTRTGSLTLDAERSQAYWKDEPVDLSLTQFWILQEIVRSPGEVKSHKALMDAGNIVVEPNTVVAYVKGIRDSIRRIDPEFDAIRTERGRGYRWVDPG